MPDEPTTSDPLPDRPTTIHTEDPLKPRGPWSFVREAVGGGLSKWSWQLMAAWAAFQLLTSFVWARHLRSFTGFAGSPGASALPNNWGEHLTAKDIWELMENGGMKHEPFGCGPGRDLSTFKALGHRVVGLDGSPQFASMARKHGRCEVLLQSFLELDLPSNHFDGVFANAVLFHVPSQELPRVLRELHATLKPGGVLFSSNPRGSGQEGWNGERYGAFHDWQAWHGFMSAAGFVELRHFYRPTGLPPEQQPWLASVWRKPAR